jgi:PhnB protein
MTSIAPWLSVRNATEALAYYTVAFAAVELERLEDDAGEVVVAQLSIDGADFWIQTDAESSPEALDGRSVRMILTVDDPDTVFDRAITAGATEVSPVAEGYGWRVGRVADPFGHHWEVGRRLATSHDGGSA